MENNPFAGVPLIVFTGLISLYLAAQLQLVVCGSVLIGFILVVFCASMSSWFTVYSCHSLFNSGGRRHYNDYNAGASAVPVGPAHCGGDAQLTQPLMTNNADFYNGYPSAPQNGGMYPSLA